jgi:hypothetical protein
MPTPPAKDAGHWLHRLSVEEWLAAADNELRLCAEALARRAFRPGVTLARRAAGMAWNAVLLLHPDDRFGRSYMEHIAALSSNEGLPEDIRKAAQSLRDTAPAPPQLIKLGAPNLEPLNAAKTLVTYARHRATQAN